MLVFLYKGRNKTKTAHWELQYRVHYSAKTEDLEIYIEKLILFYACIDLAPNGFVFLTIKIVKKNIVN